MSDWVKLDTTQLNPETHKNIRGVDITVVMSPYDVPEAVRGDYDESLKRFVIEFRYIGDEPYAREEHVDNIALRIGKNSGRLYGIEVNVDAIKANTVNLRVQAIQKSIKNAIDTLALPRNTFRRNNYQVAKDIITQKENQIFESLAAV